MKTWFNLQYLMLIRSMREAGLHPLIGLTLGLGILYLTAFVVWERIPYPETMFSILSVGILLKPTLRKRNEFMQTVFGKSAYYRVRVAEQLLIASPFTLCLIIKHAWLWAFILPLISGMMAFLQTDPGRGRVFPTPFGRIPYEAPAGFRKTMGWIALSYAVLVAGVLSGNHALFPASLIIVILTASSYFGEPDDKMYVWIFNTKPRQFLLKKWMASALCTVTMSFPVLITVLICDGSWLPSLAGIVLVGLCLNALIIAGRYSSFPDNISFANGLIMAFPIVVLPLLPVLLIWLVRRSERLLSSLLS
ncbi:MAG: hypothetical protein ACKOQY_03490 [Bacteroidota bacterium]